MQSLNSTTSNLRYLPSVDQVMQAQSIRFLAAEHGESVVTVHVRSAVDEVRSELMAGGSLIAKTTKQDLMTDVVNRVQASCRARQQVALQHTINATGVVIHTNLGRAPLSESASRALAEIGSGYCNLEYDLALGSRGRRGSSCERLLIELTGAEDAVIVNNCAAAAFLVMSVFGAGGEVIISRGELVEIGGDFRIPDVLAQAGAAMVEVGTTNRTKLADYAKAITPQTRMILRVHPSNFKIVGFTAMPDISALAHLAGENGMLLCEDIGSGTLIDLSKYGLSDEPVVKDSIANGADLVTFSGDKLLGGPQSGVIAGKADLIEKLRRHPLYRALRISKLIYAALEATLLAYAKGTEFADIPVLKMLSADDIDARTASFLAGLSSKTTSGLSARKVAGTSAIGGGAAPTVHPKTALIELRHSDMSAAALESALRSSNPPVIARISDGYVVLDLRTVSTAEEIHLMNALTRLNVKDSDP